MAAGGVKAVHRDATAVDGGGDVFEQAEEFAVVAEEDGLLSNDEAELGNGAEGFGVGYDHGAVEAVEEKTDPKNTAAGLAL